LAELIALSNVNYTVGTSYHVDADMSPRTTKKRQKLIMLISEKDLPPPKV
tara:strand:- start:191 stop:340 length:150 start_codon:yes stop_codon:yes gene_type:complete